MALNPNLNALTKEQTFSSVAKGTAHLPVALDNSYPAGGYPVSSSLLFGVDGFTFRLLNGYACNATRTTFLEVVHDVENGKLQVFNPTTGNEMPDGTNLSAYTAYLTFLRW